MSIQLTALTVLTAIARNCYNAIGEFNESVQDSLEDSATQYYEFSDLVEFCSAYYGKAISAILDLEEIWENLCYCYEESDNYNTYYQDSMYCDGEYYDYTFDSDLLDEGN